MKKLSNNSKPRIQLTSKFTPDQIKRYNTLFANEIAARLRPKLVYVNAKMYDVLFAKQTTRTMLAGRGSAKSRSGIGYGSIMRAMALPRARLFIAGPTFKHLLKNVLGEVFNAWNDFELKEGVDYVKWKAPPRTWRNKPINAPETFTYCISLRNGTTIELLSLDRANMIRGLSFDGGDWDEYALADEEDWQDMVAPTLRGNIGTWSSHWHQNVNFYTSMPRTPRGYHVFNFEELAKTHPADYYWGEANVYDNIHFWGEKGIERLRQTMSSLRFRIEIMNERIRRAELPFYPNFDPDRHTKPFFYDYAFDETGHVIKGLKLLKRDAAVDVSFDFSGWFMCCLISQFDERTNTRLYFKEVHKSGDDMLRPLVKSVCEWLNKEGMRTKRVRMYGEPRGHDKRADGAPLFEKARTYFKENGYDADILVELGDTSDEHAVRYEEINNMLAENDPYQVKILINSEGCPDLIISLQATEVTNEFKKNKSGERDRDALQQHEPHLSDCFDYQYKQAHKNNLDFDYRPATGGTHNI